MKSITLEKEAKLKTRLHELERVVIAYSGGVDSTYLLALAKSELNENAMGILVRGAMISNFEYTEAINLSQQLNFDLEILDLDVFSVDEFVTNPPERCYFCKKHIFKAIQKWAEEREFIVIDGTNFSDDVDYRPGRKALHELKIVSPLHEAKLTKEEIRELSYKMNLPTWNKPSMACLASRVPYGTPITPQILNKIERAEEILKQKGFQESRVRTHEDLARIEVPIAEFENFIRIKDEIIRSLQKLGYRFITLDLMGLRSGSLNPVGDYWSRRD